MRHSEYPITRYPGHVPPELAVSPYVRDLIAPPEDHLVWWLAIVPLCCKQLP